MLVQRSEMRLGNFPGQCIRYIMNKFVIAAVAGAAMVCGSAFAQDFKEGDWLVRARAVNLDSANKDTTGLGLSVNNKTLPEVDFTYFFNKNLAAELILTVPQKHTLSSSVVGAPVGTLKHLPPTLTLQYHFDAPGFKPYVGAGINYTRFSSVNFTTAANTLLTNPSIDKNSWGAALQVGVDIPLAKDMYLNFDVKKVYIKTDVYTTNGTVKAGTFKVDPLLVGVGLGWRF